MADLCDRFDRFRVDGESIAEWMWSLRILFDQSMKWSRMFSAVVSPGEKRARTTHLERSQHLGIEDGNDCPDPNVPKLLIRSSTATFVDLSTTRPFCAAIGLEKKHCESGVSRRSGFTRGSTRERDELE